MRQNRLTISQLAAYANVTVRAVRHYHDMGLLPEPNRDESGYRRYDAEAVIDLIKIKTLAQAGVPLTKIDTVLHADSVAFGKTITQIEDDLAKRIAKLKQIQKQLKQLRSGEGLYTPQYLIDYLDQMRALGISEEFIALERNGWILLAALFPDKAPSWVKDKGKILQDPHIAHLYQQYDQARTWNINDKRLEKLANETIELATSHTDSDTTDTAARADKRTQSLISSYDLSPYPAWKRLEEIIEHKTK